MNKLITVVVPSYNHAAFLRICLGSVVAQTYRPIELIIVDDGSTDSSKAVIRQFKKDHKEIHGVSIRSYFRKNHGAHNALNFGIKKARGAVIAILNSDDFFHPERLSLLAKPISRKKTEFTMSLISFVDRDSTLLHAKDSRCSWYSPEINARYDQPSLSLAIFRFPLHLTSGNFVFTRKLFRRLGGFRNFHWSHDYDFLLRATLHTEPVVVSRRLLSYRYHGANTVGSIPANWSRFVQEARRVFEEYLEAAALSYQKNKKLNVFGAAPYMWPIHFRDLFAVARPFFSKLSFIQELSLCNAALTSTRRKDVGEAVRPYLQNADDAATALSSLPYLHNLHLNNFAQRDDAFQNFRVTKIEPALFESAAIGSFLEIKAYLKPSYDEKLLLAGVFVKNRLVAVLRFQKPAGRAQILRGFSKMPVENLRSPDLKICWLDFEQDRFACRWARGVRVNPTPRLKNSARLRGTIETFKQMSDHLLIEGWAVINGELPEKIEWALDGKTIDVLPVLYPRPDLSSLLTDSAEHKIAGFRFQVFQPVRNAADVESSTVNIYFREKKFQLPTIAAANSPTPLEVCDATSEYLER